VVSTWKLSSKYKQITHFLVLLSKEVIISFTVYRILNNNQNIKNRYESKKKLFDARVVSRNGMLRTFKEIYIIINHLHIATRPALQGADHDNKGNR
jgi:hypothetical protein